MFILSNQFTVFIMLRYTYRSYGAPHHRVAAVEHIFCIYIMAMPVLMLMLMLWNRGEVCGKEEVDDTGAQLIAVLSCTKMSSTSSV
jgi:hypothetical protein